MAAVRRFHAETEMFVDVILVSWKFAFTGIPGACVNEKLVLECEEMRVSRVTHWNRKRVHLLPSTGVVAIEHNNSGSRIDAVPVRARSEG